MRHGLEEVRISERPGKSQEREELDSIDEMTRQNSRGDLLGSSWLYNRLKKERAGREESVCRCAEGAACIVRVGMWRQPQGPIT